MEFDRNNRGNFAPFQKLFHTNFIPGSSSSSPQALHKNFVIKNGKLLMDESSTSSFSSSPFIVPSTFYDPFDPFQTQQNCYENRIQNESARLAFASKDHNQSSIDNLFLLHQTSSPNLLQSEFSPLPSNSSNYQLGKPVTFNLLGEIPFFATNGYQSPPPPPSMNSSKKKSQTKGGKNSSTDLNTIKGQWTPNEDRYPRFFFPFF